MRYLGAAILCVIALVAVIAILDYSQNYPTSSYTYTTGGYPAYSPYPTYYYPASAYYTTYGAPRRYNYSYSSPMTSSYTMPSYSYTTYTQQPAQTYTYPDNTIIYPSGQSY